MLYNIDQLDSGCATYSCKKRLKRKEKIYAYILFFVERKYMHMWYTQIGKYYITLIAQWYTSVIHLYYAMSLRNELSSRYHFITLHLKIL